MSDWASIPSMDIPKGGSADKKDYAAKWPGLVERGYVQVPKCLITCTPRLKLTAPEARVLFIIMEKIWARREVSWQKVDTIAESAGMGNSTVRAITKSLKKKGFIDKDQRWNTSNTYCIEPTLKKLQEHLPFCNYTAQNLAHDSQKVSGTGSSFLSDYIEPIPSKTNYEEPVKRPNHINVAYDEFDSPTSKPVQESNSICPHKWEWRDRDIGTDDEGFSVTKRLFDCSLCGLRIPKTLNRDGSVPY
jgi:DNA-binding MarR family transcriptional regulator